MFYKKCFVLIVFFQALLYPTFSQVLDQEFSDIDNSFNNGKGYSNNDNLKSDLTWDESWIMMSYIRMYKAKKDVKYLQKLIRHSFNVIHQRDDIKGHTNFAGESNPTWVGEHSSGEKIAWVVGNGMISYPIAEFVHLVFTDPDLKSEVYDPSNYDCNSTPWVTNCLHNTYDQKTFEEVAIKLGHEVEKTLDHFLTGCQAWSNKNEFWFRRKSPLCDGIQGNCEWDSSEYKCSCENVNWSSCHYHPSSAPPKIPHNQGAAMGRTIYSMFMASLTDYPSTKPSSYYNDKIFGMAGYLKNNLKEKSGNSGDYYTWCYQETGCFNGDGKYEDVSHATITMDFARLCSRNNIIFNSSDMEKFANTFKENIQVKHGVYKDAVNGSNGVSPCDSKNCKWVIPRWTFLGEYDEFVSLSASQVTSQYLFCDLPMDCNISERYKDVSLLSIARLCYYRNCFNYQSNDEGNLESIDPDQKRNFYSPTHSAFDEYAHVTDDFPPSITTKDFVVEDGEVTRIVSGDRIALKPGFRAKAGSKFHAHVSGKDCSTNKNRTISNASKGNRRSIARSNNGKKVPQRGKMSCYPNPTDNVLNVVFHFDAEAKRELKEKKGDFLVIDPQGRVVSDHVFSFMELENGVKISVKSLNSGVYMGKLIDHKNSIALGIKKIIVK